MSRKLTRIVSLLFALMLTFCLVMPINVFAATTIVISGDDVNAMKNVFADKSTGLAKYTDKTTGIHCDGKAVSVMDSSGSKYQTVLSFEGTTLTFDETASENTESKYYKQAMKSFADACQEFGVSSTCMQNVSSRMVEADSSVSAYLIGATFDNTSADIFTAMKWLAPILSFLRILIGVGAIVIVMLLIASTVMDCVYIGLPMWREAQANKDGGGSGKPFGVSMEAISTVKEVESNVDGGKYKNAYLIYFRRRALTYIILAICILYLIVGELGGVIQGLLNMVSGFTA